MSAENPNAAANVAPWGPDYTTQGWSCAKCGQWVTSGYHYCSVPQGTPYVPPITTWFPRCSSVGCWNAVEVRETWTTASGSTCERYWCPAHAPSPAQSEGVEK